MGQLADITQRAIVSGTVASLVTTAALAWLARLEGRSFSQPTSSTSHWLYGEEAGHVREADARHTLLGYITHHLSAIFWALPFEAWRRDRGPLGLARDAGLVSAVAAIVDYGLVPRRLTPGWEQVLSRRSIALAYLALAAGLVLGGLMTRRRGSAERA